MSRFVTNKDVLKEIEEMNADDFPSDISTDALSTEAPSTESPSTEAPSTEAPSTEAPTTEAPIGEGDEGDEEEEVLDDDDLELIREELEEALSSKKPPEEEAQSSPTTNPPIEEINFLEEFGIDSDTEVGPENINKLLNSVYKKARADAASAAPQVDTASLIQQQMQMAEVNRDFYEKNKDLAKYKNFVSKVSFELRSKMSDEDKGKIELGEFLDRTADEARKRLRLKVKEAKSKKKEEAEKNKPKFPKQKGPKTGNKSNQKLSGIEGEIDEMNKALEF